MNYIIDNKIDYSSFRDNTDSNDVLEKTVLDYIVIKSGTTKECNINKESCNTYLMPIWITKALGGYKYINGQTNTAYTSKNPIYNIIKIFLITSILGILINTILKLLATLLVILLSLILSIIIELLSNKSKENKITGKYEILE